MKYTQPNKDTLTDDIIKYELINKDKSIGAINKLGAIEEVLETLTKEEIETIISNVSEKTKKTILTLVKQTKI